MSKRAINLRGSFGSPSDFHTHFQEFTASKRQKIMTRIFFLLNKEFQCLPLIFLWAYCPITRDVRKKLTKTLKKPCANDWACAGGLDENTQVQIYLLFHWLSLSTRLFENIAIYKHGSHFSKNSQSFHAWGAIKMEINGLLN